MPAVRGGQNRSCKECARRCVVDRSWRSLALTTMSCFLPGNSNVPDLMNASLASSAHVTIAQCALRSAR